MVATRNDTRERILVAASELFRRQGLPATGMKQISAAAGAPLASIYHFFPGGKTELAEQVIATTGPAYGEFVMGLMGEFTDLPTAISSTFATAAEVLISVDYADACPIETMALEVASTDERLRLATAAVFTGWFAAGVERFPGPPFGEVARRRVVTAYVAALEGAFVLCRALRSTEPLESAGAAVRALAEAEIAAETAGD